MQNDERIPNVVSEFKSDKIWPLFGQKNLSKWANTGVLSIFDSFLAKKWVRSYLIWILRPDLEFFHQFAYLRHAFDMICAFLFLGLQCILKNLKLNSQPLKVLEIDFFVHHRTQRVWNHEKPLDLLSISKVGVIWTTLLWIHHHCPSLFQTINTDWDFLPI